jgi:hypothetical protein
MRKSCLPQGQDRRSECGVAFGARIAAGGIYRTLVFIVVCGLFSHPPPQAFLLHGNSAEYPVKLAFLYNFTKFVEWPPNSYSDPDAPLVICIVGQNPFSLDRKSQAQTPKVSGHQIQVQTRKSNDRLSDCHIVFLPSTEKDQQEKIVRSLRGSNTLTVGESEGFAALGGIINLIIEGDQLRFEINTLAAVRAGLKISSKLLSLAKIVN